MSVHVQIWSDYVCPFCLLAKKPIDEAVDGLDVEVEWMPFELRAEPVPALRPEGDYLQGVWQRVVYPMARRMGVDIHLPAVSPQPYSRLAFEGYQYAKEHGLGTAYNDRILRAFFQDGLDIGDPDVLTGLAAELGLPAQDYRAALDGGTYRQAHQAALGQAQAREITVVPTILVGGRHRVEGVPDAGELRRAVEDALPRPRAGAACGISGC
ncbi:DsbA family protein [Streptosporangium sp. NPDC000396]|uniref:DsbA family oxidoreductase n=1 Tax=Streptosporangium sp. NPDC000396 TaxID=3366185 RepID=UPI0036943CE1